MPSPPSTPQETFDLLLSRAGLPPDAAPGATVHHAPSGPPASARSLPTITLGAGGDLVVEHLLGEGGMGVVYAAHDAVLERTVAIKRARPDPAGRAAVALLDEARTLAALDHPNIVPVHALGEGSDGSPVLVMKRVVGRPWRARIADSDPLRSGPPSGPGEAPAPVGRAIEPLAEAVDTLLAVCDALRFAHARGVLHRDVKPDNVMIGEFGEVYLMDWGCACALGGAETRALVGTPAYLAPEMARVGAPLDVRTDVYLLGATLHELLTGRPRHPGSTVRDVLAAAAVSAPARWPVGLPDELTALADQACAADPADRPPDVAAFADALRRWLSHRDADRIARDARARLPELEAAMAADDPRADVIHAECRYAFGLARKRWRGCLAAAEGLDAMNLRYAPWKLARGDLAAVAALLTEWTPPPGSTVPADLARLTAERAEAERLLREGDIGVSRGVRIAYLVALVLFAVLVQVFVPFEQLTAWDNLWVGVGFTVLATSFLVVGRRRLLATAGSRSLVLMMVAIAWGMVFNRLLAWNADAEVVDTIRTDLVWMGVCVALISFAHGLRFVWAAVPPLVAASVVSFGPPHPDRVVGAGLIGSLLVAAYVASTERRPRSGRDAEGATG